MMKDILLSCCNFPFGLYLTVMNLVGSHKIEERLHVHWLKVSENTLITVVLLSVPSLLISHTFFPESYFNKQAERCQLSVSCH